VFEVGAFAPSQVVCRGVQPVLYVVGCSQCGRTRASVGLPFASSAAEGESRLRQSSKYRGVSWTKRKRNWEAGIGYDSRNHILGYFEDEENAATAHAIAATAHPGFKPGGARGTGGNFPGIAGIAGRGAGWAPWGLIEGLPVGPALLPGPRFPESPLFRGGPEDAWFF
jgi:hypothetical protein